MLIRCGLGRMSRAKMELILAALKLLETEYPNLFGRATSERHTAGHATSKQATDERHANNNGTGEHCNGCSTGEQCNGGRGGGSVGDGNWDTPIDCPRVVVQCCNCKRVLGEMFVTDQDFYEDFCDCFEGVCPICGGSVRPMNTE